MQQKMYGVNLCMDQPIGMDEIIICPFQNSMEISTVSSSAARSRGRMNVESWTVNEQSRGGWRRRGTRGWEHKPITKMLTRHVAREAHLASR